MAAFVSNETATLAFAIMNIILMSLSTAGSLGFLIYWFYEVFASGNAHHPYEIIIVLLIIIGSMTASLIALVFGSFLLNGILKKKPEHIKAFYVYGIVKLCIVVFVLLTLICAGAFPGSLHINIMTFLILAGFASALHMVHQTYTKMQIQNDQYAHNPLKEKC